MLPSVSGAQIVNFQQMGGLPLTIAPEAYAELGAVAGPMTDRYGENRALKQRLVSQDRAHAALVFDGDEAVGWCQYGVPAELPNIKRRKEYEAALDRLPDYRLTCFFVDSKYRRKGVAGLALQGALQLIAAAGGGVVEAYPQETGDKKVSASFRYSATRSLFEQAGFSYVRHQGKNHCVMRIVIP